jgi:hypothetical protein
MEYDVLKWFKIDNSARIYPILHDKNGQNIFRVSYELREKADPDALQTALREILPKYPSFNVRMKSGFFWYFFEENRKPVKVFAEEDVKIDKIDFRVNNYRLFRVSYYNAVVSFDFFHSVTDGKGGIEFSKAVVLRYFEILGYAVEGEGLIRPFDAPSSGGEVEDSFLNNYKRMSLKDIKIKEIIGRKGYTINGLDIEDGAVGIINGICAAADVKTAAKKYGATVTEYLSGLFIYSVYKTNYNDHNGKKPIKLLIPINLRRLLPSTTLRNFTTAAIIEADTDVKKIADGGGETLGDKGTDIADSGNVNLSGAAFGIAVSNNNANAGNAAAGKKASDGGIDMLSYFISVVKEQLKKSLREEDIRAKVAGIAKLDKNILVKLTPLPIKYVVIKVVQGILDKLSASNSTSVLTNPGIVDMPESMKPHIKHMSMSLIPINGTKLNCAVLTYNGEISITFSRRYKDVGLIKFFFDALIKAGAKLSVAGNYAELDNGEIETK